MVSKYIIGFAVLALLFAAAVASDCSNRQQGRYCTSHSTYEWCYSSEPSVTLQCPMGTQCLCSYVANGNPCGAVGDKIDGCETDYESEQQLKLDSNAQLVAKRSQQATAQETGTVTCSLSSVSAAGASKKFITYFSNWAQYRPGDCAFDIAMIQGNLYTHINFAFAKIDGTSYAVLANDASDISDPNNGVAQGNYDKINSLKAKYPHLRTLLSLGGWSFGASIFSSMSSSASSRATFIASAISFVRQYNFDGIDIDWEYPAFAEQGGKPEDTVNFSTLLRELRAAIESENRGNKEKLLLTIAAPAGASSFAGLQLNVIHQYLDWINLMTYDMHASWEPNTGFHTPLYCPPGDNMCIDYAIDAYQKAGTPSEKLVLGLGTYGRAWTLANPANNKPGSAGAGNGVAGKCSGEAGTLSYFEIKEMLAAGATEIVDPVAVAAYTFLGNQWVSYDSPATIKSKIEYAHAKNLGGAMVWALDLDAPKGGFYELQCIAASNLFGTGGARQEPTGSNENPNSSNGPNTGSNPSTDDKPSEPTGSNPSTGNKPSEPTGSNPSTGNKPSEPTGSNPSTGNKPSEPTGSNPSTDNKPSEPTGTKPTGTTESNPTGTSTESNPTGTTESNPTETTTGSVPTGTTGSNPTGTTPTGTNTGIELTETSTNSNNNTNPSNNTGITYHATGEPASSGRPSPALAVIFAALTGAAVFLALSTMR